MKVRLTNTLKKEIVNIRVDIGPIFQIRAFKVIATNLNIFKKFNST